MNRTARRAAATIAAQTLLAFVLLASLAGFAHAEVKI